MQIPTPAADCSPVLIGALRLLRSGLAVGGMVWALAATSTERAL